MVPVGSLIVMAADAVLGIAIPVCLSIYLVRKHRARLSTILIGAGTFILFALVLESIMHQLVLKGPLGASILDNTLLYAIYGGLAAGVFEETGRFLSMKFLMKKEPEKGTVNSAPGRSLRYRARRRGNAYYLRHNDDQQPGDFGFDQFRTDRCPLLQGSR